MINTFYVKKKYSDNEFKNNEGTYFGESHYNKIYKKGDIDVFWKDDNGGEKILFKIRRGVIPKDMHNKIREIYEPFVKKGDNKHNQGFISDISKKYGYRSSKSKISGYFDKSYQQLNKHFETINVCRTTSFTRDNFEEWKKAIPFFERIGKIYKELAPEHHRKQCSLFKHCPPGMRIGRTPFTTITTNYNWRTACHKDRGDYRLGMGNLTVLGDNTFEGGYLGFPQFKVAVDVRPGDTVIMDVHQWHCNTELDANENRVRLSFVSYFREKMVNCNKKKVINGETFWHKS